MSENCTFPNENLLYNRDTQDILFEPDGGIAGTIDAVGVWCAFPFCIWLSFPPSDGVVAG